MFKEIDFSVLLVNNNFIKRIVKVAIEATRRVQIFQVIFSIKRRRILEHLEFLRGCFPIVFEIIMYLFVLES